MLVVFAQYLALKQLEAGDRVGAPAHVHAGFVELELHPPREQAVSDTSIGTRK